MPYRRHQKLFMFRFLIPRLRSPLLSGISFWSSFWLARIANLASLGTLGCVGKLIVQRLELFLCEDLPSKLSSSIHPSRLVRVFSHKKIIVCLNSYLLLGAACPQTPRGRWEKKVFLLAVWYYI